MISRKPLLLAAVLLLAACTAAPPSQPATLPSTFAPAVSAETLTLIDRILTDYLEHAPDCPWKQDPTAPKIVLLLGGRTLGLHPTVPGITLLCTDDCDPHDPPRELTVGDTRYQFTIRSSYVHKEQSPLVFSGTNPPKPPPIRTLKIDNPLVLFVDSIAFSRDGNTLTVRLSQNNHHNLGASGTTYTATRTKTGWTLTPGLRWMS